MAEESMLWDTTGTGDGPIGGYTEANWTDWHRYLFTPDNEATAYVLPRKGNKLAVTAGSAQVSVDTGGAIAYGAFYKNTASLNLAIATPLLGTTGFIVVLRRGWAAQTVRAAVTRNSDGVATIPTPVTTPGTTYEVVLAEGTIDISGVVTVTDRRGYVSFASDVIQSMIVNNAVGDAQLRDSAALSVIGRASNSSGDPADIVATTHGYVLMRNGTTLGFGQVLTAGIAADAVDDSKAGDRVPQFYRRQGNSSTDWSQAGTNNYTPSGGIREQWGVATVPFVGSSLTGSVEITLPVAYSNKGIAVATPIGVTDPNSNAIQSVGVGTFGTTNFFIFARRATATGGSANIDVCWRATGPE